MIAELFYPRELKEIVADLRAKGNLNENALYFLNRHIYIHAMAWIFLLSFLFTISLIVLMVGVVFAFFLISYDARDTFNRYLIPYLHNVAHIGKIKNITYNRFGGIKIHVFIELANKDCETEFLSDWRKIPALQKGDELAIFMNPKRKNSAMPDHPYFKDRYSLYLKD